MNDSHKKLIAFAMLLIGIGASANSINYGYVHGEVFGMAVGILNLASVAYLAYKYNKHTND